MKYLWYGFLGLFSLGFLGLITVVAALAYIISYYGSDLPDYKHLKEHEAQIVTRLYAGDGRLMAEFAQEKRVFMAIESMPELVKQAFLSAEDKNFYTHKGIDFFAILKAALANAKNIGTGRRPRGASTITQQVAKNFLLTNEVSYERKIKEAILASRMERVMSKDQILELYLNEIYLGQRAYGVTAAALQYFDKSLNELDIAEIAYLAALPKAPNNYHPIRKREAAIARRNWVIDRMREDGHITEGQAELAKLQPLKTAQRTASKKVNAPYFTEEVRRELAERYGEESLYGGGLVVRSSLDPELQSIALSTLREGLIAYDRRHGWRGPVAHLSSLDDWKGQLMDTSAPEGILDDWRLAVVLENKNNQSRIGFSDGETALLPLEGVTWARKALRSGEGVGPRVERMSQVVRVGDVIMVRRMQPEGGSQEDLFPHAYTLMQVPEVQGALVAMDPHTGRVLAMQGGWKYGISEFNRATQAKRQPGSAFKPFVYLAALDKGFTPATLVLDAPFAIEDRPGNIWSPTNYSNEYYGPTPIRIGVEKSRNLMTVRLADFLGMDVISAYARKFGIMDDMPPLLSNALGAGETTLLKITTAYAMLVNGGKKITPTFIDRIQNRRGKTILRKDTRPCKGCGPLIRWEGQQTPHVPDTREQVADPRTAFQIVSILEGVVQRGTGIRIKALGRPLAGKTGTTNESKDAWFIGFSPDLAVGVFVGFDEPRSLGKRETGSSVAVPIFKAFMEEALKDEPLKPFRIPRGIRNVQINADTGVRARPGDERVIWESFVIGTEPGDDMYILDGHGISLMPSLPGEMYDEFPGEYGTQKGSATTGTGGLY